MVLKKKKIGGGEGFPKNLFVKGVHKKKIWFRVPQKTFFGGGPQKITFFGGVGGSPKKTFFEGGPQKTFLGGVPKKRFQEGSPKKTYNHKRLEKILHLKDIESQNMWE